MAGMAMGDERIDTLLVLLSLSRRQFNRGNASISLFDEIYNEISGTNSDAAWKALGFWGFCTSSHTLATTEIFAF